VSVQNVLYGVTADPHLAQGVSGIGVWVVDLVPVHTVGHSQQVFQGEALLAGVKVGDGVIREQID